jgi:hypothetical protein
MRAYGAGVRLYATRIPDLAVRNRFLLLSAVNELARTCCGGHRLTPTGEELSAHIVDLPVAVPVLTCAANASRRAPAGPERRPVAAKLVIRRCCRET